MSVSARSANLCALLTDYDILRNQVPGIVDTLAKSHAHDTRGFYRRREFQPHAYKLGPKSKWILLDNIAHQKLICLLPRCQPPAIVPKRVLSYDEVLWRGVAYSCADSPKFRNSSITFKPPARPPGVASDVSTPGVIEHIFQCDTEVCADIVLLVKSYSYDGPHADPYRRYGFSAGSLCHSTSTGTANLHVIPLTSVICHCAMTSMETLDGGRFIHFLPLNRVNDTSTFVSLQRVLMLLTE